VRAPRGIRARRAISADSVPKIQARKLIGASPALVRRLSPVGRSSNYVAAQHYFGSAPLQVAKRLLTIRGWVYIASSKTHPRPFRGLLPVGGSTLEIFAAQPLSVT
jgi:hypothetical protein